MGADAVPCADFLTIELGLRVTLPVCELIDATLAMKGHLPPGSAPSEVRKEDIWTATGTKTSSLDEHFDSKLDSVTSTLGTSSLAFGYPPGYPPALVSIFSEGQVN